jgi:membrane protease YdiL (CAAX protease family)
MVTSDPPSRPSKSMLVHGAVKPWHVLFLYGVCFVTSIVAGERLTRAEDPAYRHELWDITLHVLSSFMILVLTIVVPEFRRSLPVLFSAGIAKLKLRDFALALAVMLCWGYGLYRVAFCFPLLLAYPEAFRALYFGEQLRQFEPKYLLLLFGAIIAAPLGEELVFRGFLLNLWVERWGVWPAIIASSILFGFFHWERALFATAGGVIYALVYLKYETLWPGILMHATYNLLAMEWLLGGFFYVKQKATIGEISSWLPEVVLSLLFIPALVLFWRRFKPIVA